MQGRRAAALLLRPLDIELPRKEEKPSASWEAGDLPTAGRLRWPGKAPGLLQGHPDPLLQPRLASE